jgi:hypothetical protein
LLVAGFSVAGAAGSEEHEQQRGSIKRIVLAPRKQQYFGTGIIANRAGGAVSTQIIFKVAYGFLKQPNNSAGSRVGFAHADISLVAGRRCRHGNHDCRDRRRLDGIAWQGGTGDHWIAGVSHYLGRGRLAGRWQGVGHNPLGALAVFGLLGLLAAQVATGLFSSDDIAFNGPLFSFVDQSVADRLTGYHHWLSNVLFALLGLHVGAILFYAVVKRNNLVIPMLTGWTVAHSPKPARKGSVFALVLSIAIAAVAVYGASSAGAAVHAPAAVPAPVASETATAAPAASAPAASATRTTAAW